MDGGERMLACVTSLLSNVAAAHEPAHARAG